MSAFDPKRTYVSSSAERHSQAGPYVNNLRSGGACALPIFTFFIFQSEAAWLTFLCDWRRRLLLNRKSACVFHIEEPVMRDLGPIDCFHHFGFPYACALAAFPTQPVVAKRAARVMQPRAVDMGATTGSGSPQGQGTEVQAALDALPGLFIIQLTLMGMGSPDNRRKADGSYQTQGVGRGIFCPSFARKGRLWLGFPFP
jgi:hypothetical protein